MASFFWIGGMLSLWFASYSPFILCYDFSGTFSYVSAFSFALPPSYSFVDPPMTVSSSPENILYPCQQTLSMCSQGL